MARIDGDSSTMAMVLPRPATESLAPTRVGPLVDPFGRAISYVRLSVTDRCDLRCTYCMSATPEFLPKAELLSIDELDQLCDTLVGLGARRIRLTGGEPLVRKGVMTLVRGLSRHLRSGDLDELTLTTNGTQLSAYAQELADAGVRRINVSLDTLDPERFRRITRGGDLARVLSGVAAAKAAGLRVKINTVALARDNAEELPALIAWAHGEDMDLTLIETMPLGDVEDRTAQFLSLADVRRDLESRWTLTPMARRTGGPARYVRVEETGGVLGFITPLTHEFCGGCNRVRVTATGRLVLCLGHDDGADLREVLRERPEELADVIRDAVARKPRAHDFAIDRLSVPAVSRGMFRTGG